MGDGSTLFIWQCRDEKGWSTIHAYVPQAHLSTELITRSRHVATSQFRKIAEGHGAALKADIRLVKFNADEVILEARYGEPVQA